MADRKPLKEKSKPFTSVNISNPLKMSICGNKEFKDLWDNVFKDEKLSKGDFLIYNLMKDFGFKTKKEIFDDEEIRELNRKTFQIVLDNLNLEMHTKTNGKVRFGSFQEYWKYILERHLQDKK